MKEIICMDQIFMLAEHTQSHWAQCGYANVKKIGFYNKNM